MRRTSWVRIPYSPNFFYFKFIFCSFVKINFIFKQELYLEPVEVNSTTSKGMCRVQKIIFFIIINLLYGPWHFD